jgi:hypothetical protein
MTIIAVRTRNSLRQVDLPDTDATVRFRRDNDDGGEIDQAPDAAVDQPVGDLLGACRRNGDYAEFYCPFSLTTSAIS